MTAITQIDDILYVPNIARFMDTIQNKLVYFFQNTLKPTFESKGSYIVDLFIAPNKVTIAMTTDWVTMLLLIGLCDGAPPISYQYWGVSVYMAAVTEPVDGWRY